MKLRIRGNSLRLRLTRTELAELAGTGTVVNQVQLGVFPDCALVYRMELSDEAIKPVVVFRNSQICVSLPSVQAREWARSESVGIYSEESWGLKLIVEKDFKCLDPRIGEDESDAFENPGGISHAACTATSD